MIFSKIMIADFCLIIFLKILNLVKCKFIPNITFTNRKSILRNNTTRKLIRKIKNLKTKWKKFDSVFYAKKLHSLKYKLRHTIKYSSRKLQTLLLCNKKFFYNYIKSFSKPKICIPSLYFNDVIFLNEKDKAEIFNSNF